MIKTFVGPMFSGKTALLVNQYNSILNKDTIECFKPAFDKRDMGIIKSRDYNEGIAAICINDLSDIYYYLENYTKTIFIDEAQMLTGDVSVLLDLSINKNIDIYCAGLNMTSEQKPFGIMPNIMAVSNFIEVIAGKCFDCNKPALYTYYEGKKDTDILVGNANYFSLCSDCLKKRRIKSLSLTLTKDE